MIEEPVTRRDGRTRTGKPTHWYVDATGARIPGVTTIIGDGLPKPALLNWASNITAETAVNRWDELADMSISERLKTLKGARFAVSDAAANRGTEVHALAERLIRGEAVDVPGELAGHVDAYVAFLDEWDPQPVLVEATIYHRQFVYAGTLDMVADFPSHGRLLCDVKTNRSGVWGETALQLAAYRYADRYLDDGVAHDMVEVDGCAVIWVRGDGYDVVPVRADEGVLTAFRHVAVVARTQKNLAELIGEPLQVGGDL
jgi:hypothetical protein